MEFYSKRNKQLPLPEYQWWYNSIVNDDLPAIAHHLNRAPENLKYRLLNDRFYIKREKDEDLIDDKEFGHNFFEDLNAFTLGIAYQVSMDTIVTFLHNGVDVSLQNSQGMNCIHIMVALACLKPESEDYMIEVYKKIIHHFPVKKIKEVLYQEDENKYRPLELAANYAICGLFHSIFMTKGVYLTKEVQHGISRKQYYDVTEYESPDGTRNVNSPLILLSFLSKRSINNNNKHIDNLFNSDYFNEWMHKRYRKLVVFVAIWFMMKILLFTAYVIFDGSLIQFEEKHSKMISENSTSCLVDYMYLTSRNQALVIVCVLYIVISCVIGIGIDVIELILSHKLWYETKFYCNFETVRGRKKFVYDYAGQRLAQCLLNIAMLADITIRLLRYELGFEWSQLVSALSYFMIMSQMGPIVVFFLQAIPGLGFYAVILQRMSSMFMWYFASLFVVAATPYFIAIHRLVNFGQTVCRDNFDSVYHSIYSIFLLTFNMVDFTDIDGDNEYLVVIYLVHIIFVLLIGVLLINFLIALFTNHVGKVLEVKHILVPVHLLFVLTIIELRLHRFSKWLIKRYHLHSFVSDKNGRVYVTRVVVANGNQGNKDNSGYYSNQGYHESTSKNGFTNNLDIHSRRSEPVRRITSQNHYQNTFV